MTDNREKEKGKLCYTWDIATRRGYITCVPRYYRFQLRRELPFSLTMKKIFGEEIIWYATSEDLKLEGIGRTPQKAIKSLATQLLIKAEDSISYQGEISEWIESGV